MDMCNEGCALTIRGRGRRASSYQEALQLWGRSLITERISRQKTLGSLEGTGSKWAAGAPTSTKRTPVVQRPCTELKIEIARGPKGG